MRDGQEMKEEGMGMASQLQRKVEVMHIFGCDKIWDQVLYLLRLGVW